MCAPFRFLAGAHRWRSSLSDAAREEAQSYEPYEAASLSVLQMAAAIAQSAQEHKLVAVSETT